MITTLSTKPGRHDQPLQPRHEPEPEPARAEHYPRRVGPIDRLALHVGVALIKWGRRPGAARPAAYADWEAVHRAREEREQAFERQHVEALRYRMTVPFR